MVGFSYYLLMPLLQDIVLTALRIYAAIGMEAV